MRYLAIDFGTKRTGLAICDPKEIIASPLKTLLTSHKLPQLIAEIVSEENVDEIIVGLPLNMDGTIGPQAKIVRDFAANLKEFTSLPVHFQDERLTSYEADLKLAPAEFTKKRKKKRRDAVAAAQILQAFLQQKNNP